MSRRLLVAAAPVLGVVFVGWAVLQGEHSMLTSPEVYLILLVLGALGWLVAWHSDRVLSTAPQVPIGEAKPGRVMLVGSAQPLPGRRPLISAAGRECLWYHHSEKSSQTFWESKKSHIQRHAYESTRAFLLVDESGQCLVVPQGADITTGNLDESSAHEETAILAGDKIAVTGRFTPYSSRLPAVEDNDDELPVTQRFTTRESKHIEEVMGGKDVITNANGAARLMKAFAQQAVDGASLASATSGAKPPLPAIPRIAKPGFGGLMIITNGKINSDSSIYWFLSWVDRVVMVIAVVLYMHFR